ncbi:MMPL family transporter [Salininema proteolyticum]|uniref:MMPL family transporter n=1 Tax=Salininema proteolyticum TaxID=1607685 RepID=A0ABV8TUH4_9ACTN
MRLPIRSLNPAGRRLRWAVTALWVLLAAGASVLAPKLGDVTDNDPTTFLPAGSDSTAAAEIAADHFAADTLPLMVLHRSDGTADSAAMAKALNEIGDLPSVAGEPTAPVPSEDGTALLSTVPLPADNLGSENERAIEQIDSVLSSRGLDADYTGPAASSADLGNAFQQLDGPLLALSVLVVSLVLALSYRSPLLLVLPLACIGIASQVASATAYLLGAAGLTVGADSTGMLTVVVFGAATNYALLITSRYREELRAEDDRFAAMRRALRGSLPSIAASSGTVVVALAVLGLATMSNVQALGPVLIGGVLAAVATMATLFPALAVSIPQRVLFWPSAPAPGAADRNHRLWAALSRFVGKAPKTIALATTALLAALSLGWLTVQLGPNEFGELREPTASERTAAAVDDLYPGRPRNPVDIYVRGDSSEVRDLADGRLDRAGEEEPSADGSDWTVLRADLPLDPATAEARDAVDGLRSDIAASGIDAHVGGATVAQMDTDAASLRDLTVVLPLVLLAVALVLLVLLRSLSEALLLTLCTTLSFAAAVGSAALLLPALGMPVVGASFFLYGFLFTVAMGVDYTVFLANRVKEETPRLGTARAVPLALTTTGGVITSAGLVVAATFGVLAAMPVTALAQIGVVVACGVVLDALVVRTFLVPSLLLWLGTRARRHA